MGLYRTKEAFSGVGQNVIERVYSEPGKTAGVISPWRMDLPRSENKERTTRLVRDLQKMGYTFFMGKGQYDPDNLPDRRESKWEQSFLVPDIRFEDLIKLGEKYDQDSVIWNGPTGVTGMYFIDEGYAVPATEVPETGRTKEDEFFSEFRGTGYTTPFMWDLKVPYSKNDPVGWQDLADAGAFEDQKAASEGRVPFEWPGHP